MNSRERVQRVLKFDEVDRIPRQLWALPGVWMFRQEELSEVNRRYQSDFSSPIFRYGSSDRAMGNCSKAGTYTDAWGCIWHVGEPGVIGEIKQPLLDDWAKLDSYKLPWELLNQADLSDVNRSCEQSDKFILAGTEVRPFERMQFLRGTENLLVDLAYGEKEVYKLRDMLHEFFVKELEMWADTDVDGVQFMDDWGSQSTLLISPELWRRFFKPLYREYCDILHNKGKYVFFHSDGNIEEIYPDLIEIGVNAVNSQLFCMNIEKLGSLYSGKVVFWGELDRQKILPFGTTDDVRRSVRRVASAFLKEKRTGVIAQMEWGVRDPMDNILAAFDEWDKF